MTLLSDQKEEMQAETPLSHTIAGDAPAQWQQDQYQQDIEELLILVEVFNSVPRQALIAILDERGLGGMVSLSALDQPYLVALAVHTQRPGWRCVPHIRRPGRRFNDHDASQMVDLAP